ncbi:MAG: carboxypeptidase-like regulatory domain-containing protein [Ignavibacteriaceae bacterium]|nr:carboxypeptidase-like regulatory domain-containing protein [Ignavibacterium sp.]MCC6254237.1 carboxypeptidase-like regulatory domain-containing protein [Ignavibacteriaceae bacterium]HRP92404.1 carboxypeptidase-like regulatory domain-containing protein [Ignavibacteriaceae bacterium]
MKNLITKFLFLFILSLSLVPMLFAQTGVGKLSGKIVDAATGEPLIGANVILVGTSTGAATDIEGNYFILNITPGTYELRATYVGYAPKTLENIRIVAGITYDLNIEMSTDFTLDEIVVIDRKFFEEKATNTVKVIDSDQISRLPVRGVTNIASLQSGVVIQEGSGGQEGNATINVRGGRGSEVLYIVDGVPQNNLYNRSSVASVSNVAIEQISFQVGGYEAKYGQAQSGIINVTTKSGQPTYTVLTDIVSSTFTDDFGYNLYAGTISGPIIPGYANHTIFLSAERGWFQNADPTATEISFPSINKTQKGYENNPAGVWRFSGKTNHRVGDFSVNLSGLYNDRTAKVIDYRYQKNNSRFNQEFYERNVSLNARLSQTLSNTTFWNLNLGYKMFDFKRYNPFFKDNLVAYGDSAIWANQLGVILAGDGQAPAKLDQFGNVVLNDRGLPTPWAVDNNGVFRPYGYTGGGLFQKREDNAFFIDFDITSQIDNHLLEFGTGFSQHTVRGYGVFANDYSAQPKNLSETEKFERLQPFVYGYDVTGQTKTTTDNPNQFLRPYKPDIGYAYLQDRFELNDIVLNVGLRLDFYNLKSYVLKNPDLPYAGGTDPENFDPADFQIRDAEVELSPRIGIGFPVTTGTVFHAQYGRFIQLPELNDVYFGPYSYNDYLTMAPQSGFNGALRAEETIQYEVGFRQLLSDNSALNITAFYKNIRDLVNVQNHKFRRVEGGQLLDAIYPENSDFGTTKGLALSLDITHLSYFSVSMQYTFSIAEGTGSSTSSSSTSVFRNTDNSAPKVIAPLNFDQRHTGVVNIDFYVPKGELGWFEMFNANMLFSFSSGRPYTPMDQWNLLGDNGINSTTKGYINSAFAPGSFRIDLKMEKSFAIGDIFISPYIWIENLLDADNITGVYRSTGSPYTTGYLTTPGGMATSELQGEGFVQDYKSLENNPANFGIPRLIKLGFKLNFSNISL